MKKLIFAALAAAGLLLASCSADDEGANTKGANVQLDGGTTGPGGGNGTIPPPPPPPPPRG